MPDPHVSFVLPCYNYGRYLPDCLNSILAQAGDWRIEIIAVNDGSPDNTAGILREYQDGPGQGRLQVIAFPQNRGHVAALTAGFEAARGEFIVHTDPDDRYRPNFLARVLPIFAENPAVGMVYSNVAMIDGEGRINLERCDLHHRGRDFRGNELVALMESNFICAPTVTARRETWLRQLPIPAHLSFTDWYFTLMMARDFDFFYLDEPLAEYRIHSTNLHSKLISNRGEEPSTFWLLDQLYATPEKFPELEVAKQEARSRIYAAQYHNLGIKYFGAGMVLDARRCFLKAARRQPSLLLRGDVLRYLAATYLGLERYKAMKSVVRGKTTA